MKTKKIGLTWLAFLATLMNLQAHALWIQTTPIGAVGKDQQVIIHYAEPGQQPEQCADWYSDVAALELWLTAPNGNRQKLVTLAAEDYLASKFIPDQEGVYTLSIGHTAKEPGGTTVYQFNASALVKVGKSNAGNDVIYNKNDLSVFADASKASKVNKPVRLVTRYKNTPGEKIIVAVSSPSGWSKQIETNEKGEVDFVPLWPGTYYIEASKSWKENGVQAGKNYTAVWRAATVLLDVVK